MSLEATVLRMHSDLKNGAAISDTARLGAVQGSSEARTELYAEVLRRSTAADDVVMRQESWQSSELGSEAGQDGEGVW